MGLVSVAELRAVVTSALTDAQLQTVLDREEREMITRTGPHGDGVDGLTLTLRNPLGLVMLLPRPLSQVISVAERQLPSDTPMIVPSDGYWLDFGSLNRLSGVWASFVTVVGIPADLDRRKSVLIELVRQALEQTALKSESVAGEYSWTAPDWERQRADLYRRLTFMSI
jgi:hypothetical protein